MFRNLFALLPLFGTAVAGAQVGREFHSLEAMIGQSQTVAVGRIIGVTEFPDRGQTNLEVTVSVEELIKGEPAKVLRLKNQLTFREELFKRWQTDKTKLLVFVPYPDDSIPYGFEVHSLADRMPEGKVRDPYLSAMFSMDYRLLGTPKLILNAARAFAKKHPGEVKVWAASSYPPFNSPKFPSGGDVNTTYLPALPEVKAMAQEMVEHPERWVKRFFGPGGFPYDPVYGAELKNDVMKAEAVRNLGRSVLKAIEAGGWPGQFENPKFRLQTALASDNIEP